MTRHGKNATASAVYSYSERRKDASQSGYGTLHERLGADSVKPFDCCSLTLQPCREPLISPDGFVFDKESILTYIVEQKKEYKRQVKVWEQQCKAEVEKNEMERVRDEEKMKERFIALESTPVHSAHSSGRSTSSSNTIGSKRKMAGGNEAGGAKKAATEESVSNMAGDKAKQWNNFWVPELSTTAEKSKIEKPSPNVLCPISGKPLKFKDLMAVKFTPIEEESNLNKMFAKKERYMCPITRDVLTNTTRCAYLKPSQCVVSMACVDKIIRKDMIDPISGKVLEESDIIELQRGGTGFSATNQVKAKLVRPQLELQ
jgi:nitric oxide synthase-interacting protein